MDVDGTLTDGKIYMGNEGEVCKSFDVKDGLGLKILMSQGITPAIITGRRSQIVLNRAKEIGIGQIHQGVKNKAQKLLQLMEDMNLTPDQVAYIGDDLNDLSALKVAGITFAPADCGKQILPYVDFHLTKKAGQAPVREAIDMIIDSMNLDFSDFLDL